MMVSRHQYFLNLDWCGASSFTWTHRKTFARAALAKLHTASLTTRSHPVHALFRLLLHDIRSGLDQPSKTRCSCILGQILPVRVVDDIVDIAFRDAVRDVLLKQLAVIGAIPFGAGAVQDKLDATFCRITDVLEAVVLKLGALGAIFAVHVAEGGS